MKFIVRRRSPGPELGAAVTEPGVPGRQLRTAACAQHRPAPPGAPPGLPGQGDLLTLEMSDPPPLNEGLLVQR